MERGNGAEGGGGEGMRFVSCFVCVGINNNNVHLSCAHQRPERLHDTY